MSSQKLGALYDQLASKDREIQSRVASQRGTVSIGDLDSYEKEQLEEEVREMVISYQQVMSHGESIEVWRALTEKLMPTKIGWLMFERIEIMERISEAEAE